MGIDPSHAHQEAHTDPFLPRIIDDPLPPLASPRVPTLDDRALAELIAELDGDDLIEVAGQPAMPPRAAGSDAGEPAQVPRQRGDSGSPPPVLGRAALTSTPRAEVPAEYTTDTDAPEDVEPASAVSVVDAERDVRGERGVDPASEVDAERDVRGEPDAYAPRGVDAEPDVDALTVEDPVADVEPLAAADVEPSERADAEPSDQANAEPSARADAEPSGPAAGRPATWFAPEDDPTVLCQSADGPVLRSRYGDFRPPVPVGRPKGPAAPPDPASLTGLGLTRRTWGHVGSRLFTLVFVAIFVLILVQVVIGMVSSAASP